MAQNVFSCRPSDEVETSSNAANKAVESVPSKGPFMNFTAE